MELRELLDTCREETDDELEPYLCSDKRFVKYLNEAMREAAVRARLLVESTLPAVCAITMVPGQASYVLDASVLIIRRAVLRTEPGDPLCRTTTAVLDCTSHDWRTRPGTPRFLAVDQQGAGRKLTLSPVPDKVDTLDLTVVRLPVDAELFEEDDETAEPPFEQRHHEKLVHWAVFRAMSARDVEQGSTNNADRHLQLFEQHFGPMPTAAALQQLSTDRVSGTQAHPF